MSEEQQMDLFDKSQVEAEMFYIYEVGDDSKFPVLGFENADVQGKPYVAAEQMKIFAVSVLDVLARSCPNHNFTIEWGKIEVFA